MEFLYVLLLGLAFHRVYAFLPYALSDTDDDLFVPRQASSIDPPLSSAAQSRGIWPSPQGTAPADTSIAKTSTWPGTAPASLNSVLTSFTAVSSDIYNSSRQPESSVFNSLTTTISSIISPTSINQNFSTTPHFSGVSSSLISAQPEPSSVVAPISPIPAT
ncbi:hypothetical protein Ptr902_09847 [Pyrenophora tritici-repentis]|nr:hypothetical protein PtrV1_11459 [Pyrenophora tritici-repentis]KAF7444267.1 hypothetical protein A1F99_108200 [Pyrenophora tritici-repentis]KAI2478881.1 hypothetical protein Ptr902_09847 [Pyrenophora tritici-repentis]